MFYMAQIWPRPAPTCARGFTWQGMSDLGSCSLQDPSIEFCRAISKLQDIADRCKLPHAHGFSAYGLVIWGRAAQVLHGSCLATAG